MKKKNLCNSSRGWPSPLPIRRYCLFQAAGHTVRSQHSLEIHLKQLQIVGFATRVRPPQ